MFVESYSWLLLNGQRLDVVVINVTQKERQSFMMGTETRIGC